LGGLGGEAGICEARVRKIREGTRDSFSFWKFQNSQSFCFLAFTSRRSSVSSVESRTSALRRRFYASFSRNEPVRSACSSYTSSIHIDALPIQHSSVSWGRLHGSRSHRLSSAPYNSDDLRPSPPATMTHPATAPHANPSRASCMGGRGSQCASPPSNASASHDDRSVFF
jgi:hypothetical protein